MHINDMNYNSNLNIMNNVNMQDNNTPVAAIKAQINAELLNMIDNAEAGSNGNNIADSSKDATIYKILDTNGLLVNDKNYRIADELIKNNMPVDKNSMQRIIQQTYKYGENEIKSIVALNRIGIKVNSENIAQYKDYINNTHQLSKNITEFTDTAIRAFESEIDNVLQDENGTKNLLAVNDKLVNIFSKAENSVSQENNISQGNALNQGNDFAYVKENMNLDKPELVNEAADGKGEIVNEIAKEAVSENIEKAISENINEAANKAVDGQTIKNDNIIKKVIDTLREIGIEDKKIEQAVSGSDSRSDFLDSINSIIKNEDKLDFGDFKEFLKSEGYTGLLKQVINEKMTINPEKMKSPSEIDDVYREINDKTNKLLNAFSENDSPFKGQLEQQARGMNERLDFINALNNVYTYAQIPLNINSKELNSELFVYTNKKGKNQNKEAVSALLHLDMEHLGATDVHVSLHGGVVHTRFYVDDENSARIIDEHMSMLEKAINETGYQLTNEVINREVSIDTSNANAVVNNMLDTDLEKSVRCYSFDARM